MSEETTIDPIYKKGFEHGYWLQRGDSKDLDGIIQRSNHDQYKSGLKAGKKEAVRERVRQQLQDNSGQSQDVNKEIDID
ncbi:MAG: hypothetical protein J0L80_15920 [Chitinophagales bacterium]|nr:hypothetical protein [Chitinophagales bacterium]